VLIFGRFLLALGSGVGLKMTFTMVNELYEPQQASRLLSYLIIAFAIMPGLSVALGGILITHFDWSSTFYACALYGIFLLVLVTRLTETKTQLDLNAFKISYLIKGYTTQFKNVGLIIGGLIIGGATCCLYAFSTLAPFIAIQKLQMPAIDYGLASLLPALGLLIGSLFSASLIKTFSSSRIIYLGIFISLVGGVAMLLLTHLKISAVYSIFLPAMFSYSGLSLVFANTSGVAMQYATDKANASAVMNFINIGFAMVVMLVVGKLDIEIYLLPILFLSICGLMAFLMRYLIQPDI
ncbi:MAG: MFS transporter, partial [Gammaproteobacteria bacterium]